MGAAQYNDRGVKKLLTALLALVLAIVLVAGLALGVGSLRWWPSRREGPPRLEAVTHGAGPLLAGSASVALAPPAPLLIAGFPRLQWQADGLRDAVAVRAVAVQEPGCTVVLVSMEILLVPGALERAVTRRVRDLPLDHLVVAATHTHAGPGGFWHDALGERLATGPYQEAAFDHLVDAAEKAIRQAVAALEPAYLATSVGRAPELVRNRGGREDVDARMVMVRLAGLSGRRIADLVVFPSHATLLGLDNRLVSGDWPGALMRARAPVIFFQGALGDQTPRIPPRHSSAPDAYARRVADALDRLEASRPEPWPELAVATARVVLPPADLGASPPFLKRVTRNVLYDWLPDRARLAAIRLGPLTLVAVPGEPVAEVGRRWREAAGEGVELLALAGDYLGYVETSERMAEQAGETVRTYYGPELAERLAGAVKLVAEAVRPERAAEAVSAGPGAAAAGSAATARK
jgi:hypothetical protein